ncbi:MAG: HesA/MoeB/ThiF family protein [Deltaproteobacteria bacterium]|nr:HesA/MoeB/ThiF family protein [Deltaproteobacteria bacterium]
MLNQDEREKYARQMVLKGFGQKGQEKLKRATVFIAGAGGLGSSSATYLAAAGVGMLRIVDHDKVELSNLNRQILHWPKDIGKRKVGSAKDKLNQMNPQVKIEAIEKRITEANVCRLVEGCDLIVDAMDNLPTRYLLNKTAIEKNIPFFHGAVYGFEGRAMTVIPGQTACLRCVYRGAIAEEECPVIGVTPAVIGCIQATEVIKYLVGIGQLLANRLLVYDGLNMKFTEFKIKKDPNCPHCGKPAKGKK